MSSSKPMENNQFMPILHANMVLFHPIHEHLSNLIIVIETIVDIVDQVSKMESPIYFDPEQDELIENKTYFTNSFYTTEQYI
ncbi:unnamed protein product [Rotaria sp. Silwood1]|nr:unnamed protein product [Rotaria sp. Silwood1]